MSIELGSFKMLKTNKIALLIFVGIMGLIQYAKADTVFSTTAPTAPLKVQDIDDTKEFYKCSLIKRGPNFNPIKAGPTIFTYTAPTPDDTAISKLKDKTVKVYRCELQEVNATNGRVRKVKDNI
jgi:hypothetical protein